MINNSEIMEPKAILATHSSEYSKLERVRLAVSLTEGCESLLSLNAVCLDVAIEACEAHGALDFDYVMWKGVLPLGEALDVNFNAWGGKLWWMLQAVSNAYKRMNVECNSLAMDTESYVRFKDSYRNGSLEALVSIGSENIPNVAICAIRELYELVMNIAELLNNPSEELITQSFESWFNNYQQVFGPECRKVYCRWKNYFGKRTRRKHLMERREKDLASLKKLYFQDKDDEFEEVFDPQNNCFDMDGIAHYLFKNPRVFGFSSTEPNCGISKELHEFFDYLERWRMMEEDLRPRAQKGQKEREEKKRDTAADEVLEYVGRIGGFAAKGWETNIHALWQKIVRRFAAQIMQAGKRETFKKFSKKTVCCIVGHLKKLGIYENVPTAKMVVELEGKNTALRNYLGSGLAELNEDTQKEIKAYISEAIKQCA